MSDKPATRKDIDIIRKDIDDVLGVLKEFIQQTDERFNVMSYQINSRFDKIENEIIDLKKSHDKLLNTFDKFIGRIDNYETEQITRDSQFNKLLAWA